MKKSNDTFKIINILFILSIIMLIFFSCFSYFNMNELANSTDKFRLIVGVFGKLIVPYLLISLIVQMICFILFIINKGKRKVLNIIVIILEIVYIIFLSLFINGFIYFNLLKMGNILAGVITVIFEIINFVLLLLIIKFIIKDIK